MSQPALGWVPRKDPKTAAYTLVAQTGIDVTKPVRPRSWTRHVVLNQNNYRCLICRQFGACTGYGAAHLLAMTPRAKGGIDNVLAHAAYHAAKHRDVWAGENYEGSSGLGVMQALKDSGNISAYWNMPTVDQLVHAISRYGPVGMGSWWHQDMFTPDSNGRITPTGRQAGGHFYVLGAVNPLNEKFRVDNSWGTGWGIKGSATMSFDAADNLLNRDGEAFLPRKFLRGAVQVPTTG